MSRSRRWSTVVSPATKRSSERSSRSHCLPEPPERSVLAMSRDLVPAAAARRAHRAARAAGCPRSPRAAGARRLRPDRRGGPPRGAGLRRDRRRPRQPESQRPARGGASHHPRGRALSADARRGHRPGAAAARGHRLQSGFSMAERDVATSACRRSGSARTGRNSDGAGTAILTRGSGRPRAQDALRQRDRAWERVGVACVDLQQPGDLRPPITTALLRSGRLIWRGAVEPAG